MGAVIGALDEPEVAAGTGGAAGGAIVIRGAIWASVMHSVVPSGFITQFGKLVPGQYPAIE